MLLQIYCGRAAHAGSVMAWAGYIYVTGLFRVGSMQHAPVTTVFTGHSGLLLPVISKWVIMQSHVSNLS